MMSLILTPTGKLKLKLQTSNDSSASAFDFEQSGSEVLAAKTWSLVGFSHELNNDAVSCAINFRIGNGNTSNPHKSGDSTATYYYHYRNSSDKFEFGRVVANASNTWFTGFIYSAYVNYGKTAAASEFPHVSASSCSGCSANECTETAAECPGKYDFTNASDNSKGCNTSGACNGKACRHPGTVQDSCKACTGTDPTCWLCYDAECTDCSGYNIN